MNAKEPLVLIAGLLLARAAGADAVPLGRAASKGIVKVRARATRGYGAMAIDVQNVRTEEVTVDVFGSMFVPSRSGVQPLGVARLSVEGGGTRLTLAGKETWRGELPSFCLKGSASSPRSGHTYTLADAPVPPRIREVFEYWNEHPKIAKGDVQTAVWRGSAQSLANAPERRECRRRPPPPPPPYVRPENPRVVLLGGLDYLLKLDGKIVIQDHLSSEEREDIEAGGDFCAIYACGGRLCALRRRTNAGRYEVHLREGTAWRSVGTIDVLPESAVLPPEGRPVFLGGGKVYSVDGAARSMVNAPVAMMSMGKIRGHTAWVCLSRQNRLVAFDPRNAAPRPALPSRRFRYFAVGEEIVVHHTGSRLVWERPRRPIKHRNFARKIDRTFVDGGRVCVFSDGCMWRMDEEDVWNQGPELPADIADAVLDGTTGDLHILDSAGRLHIYRMADVSR